MQEPLKKREIGFQWQDSTKHACYLSTSKIGGGEHSILIPFSLMTKKKPRGLDLFNISWLGSKYQYSI